MAATLFGHYSLETASRNTTQHSQRAAERAAMNVSPTCQSSYSPPSTPPPCSVGDLAQQFTQQTLHVEVDPAYRHYGEEPLTPSDDDFTFPRDVVRPSYCRLSTAVLRQQRQANMRMQCSTSHMKDISRLVQMIEENDQCRLYEPRSRTPSNSTASTSSSSSSSMSDDDEGVDMDYTPPFEEPRMHKLPFRRSSDRSSGSASVTKNVRVRKHARVVKRSSR